MSRGRSGRLDVEDAQPDEIVRPARSPRVRSRLVTMMSFATRTLWECSPGGMSIEAMTFGFAGSVTSTTDVPCGGCMCPT